MKKSVLLIVSMWLLSGQIFAQRFEWAKGFASGENVTVVGSVTDSVGNLYILGSINFNTCWENGSRLLPIVPHDNAHDYGDAMIAKISPAGDWVWHKVIHGNYTNSVPYDIKSLGDTAFACLIEMPLATWYYYLYYLDTLINPTWHYGDTSFLFPDYPMSAQDSYDYAVLALITFDFDGNVLEQHFLQMSYLDYNGDDIRYTHPSITNPLITNARPMHPSFAMDGEGNIYLSRWINDRATGGSVVGEYSLREGTISAVKFWCDRRMVGVVTLDSSLFSSPQILKFSPHFDTLLEGKCVYQSMHKYIYCYGTHVEMAGNSLYLLINNSPIPGYPNEIIIDSANGLEFRFDDRTHVTKDIIVKYNTSLETMGMIHVEDSIIDASTFQGKIFSVIEGIAYDIDSNYLIVSCAPRKNIGGDTMTNLDNSFFL